MAGSPIGNMVGGMPGFGQGGGQGGGQPMGGYGTQLGAGPGAAQPYGSYTPTGGNVYQQAAGAYGNGLNNMNFASSAGAVPMTMNQYLNPYQGQVINNTLGRMQDQGMQDLNMVRAQAAQSGAYGGARQGLVEAELMDRYNRNMYETAGSLNQQGFNTAAQLGQNRIGQIMQGGQSMVNAAPVGVNMGNQVLAQQGQAGAMQQGMMQQILDQATRQYDTFQSYPQTALGTALAGVNGNPLAGATTSTTTQKPGLFNYLSLGAGLGSAYLGGPGMGGK